MNLKRVVITGLGTVNPLGNDVKSFEANLDAGVSGAALIDSFDTSLFKTKFACPVKNFSFQDLGYDRKEERKNDRFCQFAMISADQAIADSGITPDNIDYNRVGVLCGTGIGGLNTLTQEIMDYNEAAGPRFSPFLVTKMITDIASGQISIKYGFKGPNYSISAACATSAAAIATAMQFIQLGKADAFITGGSECAINVVGIGGFNSMHALSTNNEEYISASRPFDKTRDGFVMGEGAAILVLEEYEHAKARGAHIYAELAGAAFTADAYHLTAPDPNGRGAAAAMRLAMQDAGIALDEVDYINVHGTATHHGDIAETLAIKDVFGKLAYGLNISSTKSMTGHLLGAAGAIESIACLHAINNSVIPPTINFTTEDDDIDYNLNLTLNKKQERNVNIALNNSFGFGGHNTCLVFRKI